MENEFKFNLGDDVCPKGNQFTKMQIIGRSVEETYSGSDRKYLLSSCSMGQFIRCWVYEYELEVIKIKPDTTK